MVVIEGKTGKLEALTEYIQENYQGKDQMIMVFDSVAVPQLKELCNIYVTSPVEGGLQMAAYMEVKHELFDIADVIVISGNVKRSEIPVLKKLENKMNKVFVVTCQNEQIEPPVTHTF